MTVLVPRQKPVWWMAACRKRFGLTTKRPPKMPKPAPQWCLEEWARLERYMAERDAGRNGHGIWPTGTPPWANALLKEIHDARAPQTSPKPVPVPPKHSRWVDPPWAHPNVYVAWAFEKDDWDPEPLASQMASHGVELAWLIANEANEPFHEPFKAALHARGRKFGIWEDASKKKEVDTAELIRRIAPDCYAADVENPMSDPDFIEKFDKDFPDLPRVLCATGGGIPTPEIALPWTANWDLQMQDYIVHGPNMAPDHGENFAYWRQFPINALGMRHFPLIEVNAEGSPELTDQLASVEPWGAGVGLYTVEYFTNETWAAIPALHG